MCSTYKVLLPAVSGILASNFRGAAPFDPVVTFLAATLHLENMSINIHVRSVVNVRTATHAAFGSSL